MRDGRLVAEPHPEVAARRGEQLLAGRCAPVMDVEWTPSPGRGGDELLFGSGTGKSALVRVDGRRVSLERPGEPLEEMPWTGGPLRVLVDGPVVEISSADGLLGGAIHPVATWLPPSGPYEAWRLHGARD